MIIHWKEEDTARLIDLYPNTSNKELAVMLNRTVSGIQKKGRSLGLNKSAECLSAARKRLRGKNSPLWKGKGYVNNSGYMIVRDEDNPGAGADGRMLEHRKVMGEFLGRPVALHEAVHHINGIKTDNRIENLELIERGLHTAMHHTGMKRSIETRAKISEKAKARLNDPRNHPLYKHIPREELIKLSESGMSINEICEHYNITRTTYQNKLRGTI